MIPTRAVARLLQLTAIVNIGGGLSALAAPSLQLSLLFGPEAALDPLGMLHFQLVWAFVVAVGVGYALAAREPERHRAMVIAGGLGKVAAAALWTGWLLRGLGGPALLGGILFDGALGAVFLAWAWGRR